MIDFYINGEKVEVQLESEKTVGDVLNSFELTCEQNEAAVIGILINEKQITAEIFDEEAKKDLSEVSKIEFSVVTKQQIKESFTGLSNLFNELSNKMQEIPVELQKGNNKEASTSIKKLADSIDQFCHIAALASLFPETFSNEKLGNLNFKAFLEDISPILKDFEEALQNNDTVLVGDLSEYEICPRLQAMSQALSKADFS